MTKMAAVVIMLGLLVSAPRGSLAAPVKTFLWEGPVAAGKSLDLGGLNGPIHAVRARGGTAVVKAVKSSRRADPDVVRIEQWESDNTLWFCAVYPGQRSSSANPCDRRSQHSHTNGDEKNQVMVEWEVEVPDGVRLLAHTVNGDLDLEDLAGPVEAATVNGSIRLGTRDEAEATTVNGTIEARLGTGRLPHDLAFRTVNGSIVLELADGLAATVVAEALNGEFESDFPVTITAGRIRKNRLRGTINGGGALLSMTTVNGSLALRRYSSASK
jgi:hypothetical protein